MRSRFRPLTLWVIAFSSLAPGNAARADDLVQAPQLAAPQRGSLAGEYGRVVFGPADVDRGGFSLPGPFAAPSDRGQMLGAVFPSYSPDAGISEWGSGWSNNLAFTRTRILGSIDYATDELSGPWGRMIHGSDGAWYALNLGGRVKVAWQEPTITATLPSGDSYTFGGDARFVTTQGTYAWYLTDVVTLTGRRTHLVWSKNASGRPFLQSVQYGGSGTDYQYEIDFTYENTKYLFASYASGAENVLDQRVHAVTVRAKNAATGSFAERWHYTLVYQEEGWGPAFYLAEVDKQFAAGDIVPPTRYSYQLAATNMPNRKFVAMPALDKLTATYGLDVIQSNRSTVVDIDADGRPDLEEATGNAILKQTDQGYVATPLPALAAGASPLCRRAPSRLNPPRNVVEAMDGGDALRVLGFQTNSVQTKTEIDFCERDGTPLTKLGLNGSWVPGKNVKLVDLDRDRKPDLIRLDYGYFTVLPNISTANTLAFDTPRTGLLQPAFTPTATFVQDINGDGIADLVARTSASITVWLGTGNFNFVTEGETFSVRALNGMAVGALDRFDFHFVDMNRDGLTDLLLTASGSAALYVNNGYYFQQVDAPALGSYGVSTSAPVVADLAGTGNSSIALTAGGKAFALDLDDASIGLLAGADDGAGNVLRFAYARGPAAAGGRQRHSVLASLTVTTTGLDPVRYNYAYQTPSVHSLGKLFLGFAGATRQGPLATEAFSFLNDDDAQGVVLSSSTSDSLTPAVQQYQVNTYAAALYQGVPWLRPTSSRSGWSDASGAHTLEERTDYLAYEAEVCPSQIRVTKEAGTLTTLGTRATSPGLANALHCVPETLSRSGVHPDARWNFADQQHFTRNDVGLAVSIESIAGDGALTQQQVSYNADGSVATIALPGRGTMSFSYDPATHLLQSLSGAEGVVTSVVRDPLTDAILLLRTDHGGAVLTQSFRFDGQERLIKSWDDVGQASESNPLQALSYQLATATRLASIYSSSLVDARSGSAQQVTELATAAGDPLAKARLIPEGWTFTGLTQRLVNQGEVKELLRPTVASAVDPGAFDLPTLLAGGQLISDVVTASTGTKVSALTWFHADAQQELRSTLTLNGHLVETAVENSAFTTTRMLDAGKRPVAYTDEAGTTWGYHYDAANRLRAVDLPDGTSHRLYFDGHGRVSRIERDGVATISYAYVAGTDLPAGQTYYSPAGDAIRGVSWSYDAVGRKQLETDTDLIANNSQTYTYYYDGATPDQPTGGAMRGLLTAVRGDGFVKTMSYRADAKLSRRSITFPGWRTVTTTLDYTESGAVRTLTTEVLHDGAVLESTTQTSHYDAFGRLASTDFNGAPTITYGHDPNGLLNQARFADGSVMQLQHDPYARSLVGLSLETPSWTAGDQLHHDARGLVDSEGLTAGAQTIARQYHHSAQKFLSSAVDGQSSASYTYLPSGLPLDISENGVDRAISQSGSVLTAGGVQYQLDSLGRTVSIGDLELTYGPKGDIARAQRGGSQWQFVYDEAGQRIMKSSSAGPIAAYLEDGYLDGSGLTQPFRVGGITVGIVRNGQLQLVPIDLRGTVLADHDGTARFPTPFGNRAVHPDLAAALDYVNQGYDADLRLVRMGVRDYDPTLDRFITPDPLFLGQPDLCVGSPIECNLYSYARNQPLSFTDPQGTDALAGLLSAAGQALRSEAEKQPTDKLVSMAKGMAASSTTYELKWGVNGDKTVKGIGDITEYKDAGGNTYLLSYHGKISVDTDGQAVRAPDPHHRDNTSMHIDGRTALDAAYHPYMVITKLLLPKGVEIGDLAVITNGDTTIGSTVGDAGPKHSSGEAAMATLFALHVDMYVGHPKNEEPQIMEQGNPTADFNVLVGTAKADGSLHDADLRGDALNTAARARLLDLVAPVAK
jgi:RHS repeat-associated protein